MAFEQLYRFPDEIRKEVERIRSNTDLKCNYYKEVALIDALYIYYETVLQPARFRSQRDYCRKILGELNPALARGYFDKKKIIK